MTLENSVSENKEQEVMEKRLFSTDYNDGLLLAILRKTV